MRKLTETHNHIIIIIYFCMLKIIRNVFKEVAWCHVHGSITSEKSCIESDLSSTVHTWREHVPNVVEEK